ncbi:hypothetical protein RHSIM_Rhsim09G0169600 [Rhododendron simsii]|uniref:Mitochondrial substrate carrier family protein n=1 Tax=Rhododendron simsii TaxID=118357 RepID=A0A834GEN7_RHOSS|nr:hypothetical protein RHSIM_Rhsim09G0169600 [Rhododendron simsii]
MQTEARVGEMALDSSHGGVVVVAQQKRSLQHQQSQIGTVSQLLAGGVAGAVSKTCTAPLARLTILFQVQGMHSDVVMLRKASILHEASRIVREEGFRAFWKGNLVTIAHRLPYSSISFYAFERYKNVGTYLLQNVLVIENQRENVGVDVFIRLVGGGLAGITAASVTYPLDLVRTRLAAQTNVTYYRGIWHALRTITREEGASGLYKGLGATLLGVGPNLAISFSVYDSLRTYWKSQRPDDSTALVSLACGSVSGIASSTEKQVEMQTLQYASNRVKPRARDPEEKSIFIICQGYLASGEGRSYVKDSWLQEKEATFPLDLVRRRMQLEGAGGRARVYTTGLFSTFGYIFRAEGLRGLYRGILPEYFKVVPSIGIVFMTYEKMKQILSDIPTNG